MSGLRLILVTRRYWPLVGGAEMIMSHLASEFQAGGAQPRILTAQWEHHWPTEIVHRDVAVIRLPNPPLRGWGTFRYMRALARWLRQNRGQFDAVLVSMLKHDAYAVLGALRGSNLPVVLRAEGAGATGDVNWLETYRFGRRIKRRCLTADAFVAASDAIMDEFVAAGFPRQRLHCIPNGVPLPPPRAASSRAAARLALAEVNRDLAAGENEIVVVYTGRLHASKGLFDLLEAWPLVLRRWPHAQLWLIGEGPHREELFHKTLQLGLRGSVLLPGAFDDVGDVLQAADLFVLPSYAEGLSLALMEAMAAEVPIVASDVPGNRQLITHGEHGLLVPPRNIAALAEAMQTQLEQSTTGALHVMAARRKIELQYTAARMAASHLALLEQLVATRSAPAR